MAIGSKIARRSFLQLGAMTVACAVKGNAQESPVVPNASTTREKFAAITSAFTMRSTADNIVTRLLQGYWIGNDYHEPQCDVISLYEDRKETTSLGPRMSEVYGITLAHSVSDALTLSRGSLAIDGVVIACDDEYADAAVARSSRDLKFRLFEQVVEVFRKCGRSVPVFCAGRLAAGWDQAKQMQQWSKELSFPLMSGTSTSVTFRRPDLDYPLPHDFDDASLGDRAHHDFPLGVDFDEGLVVCPSGPSAVFCSFEILQAFLERRRTGETGIRSLECLVDEAVWKSARDGRWSTELMRSALGRAEALQGGRPEDAQYPAVCLVEYNDGTRSAILSLGGIVNEYLAAFRLKGRREIDSTLCYTPAGSANDFSMLAEGFLQMVITGKSPYPVERNLLTTGAFLQWLRISGQNGGRIETQELHIAYAAPEHSFYAQCRGW